VDPSVAIETVNTKIEFWSRGVAKLLHNAIWDKVGFFMLLTFRDCHLALSV
jgi:hypothetical protein